MLLYPSIYESFLQKKKLIDEFNSAKEFVTYVELYLNLPNLLCPIDVKMTYYKLIPNIRAVLKFLFLVSIDNEYVLDIIKKNENELFNYWIENEIETVEDMKSLLSDPFFEGKISILEEENLWSDARKIYCKFHDYKQKNQILFSASLNNAAILSTITNKNKLLLPVLQNRVIFGIKEFKILISSLLNQKINEKYEQFLKVYSIYGKVLHKFSDSIRKDLLVLPTKPVKTWVDSIYETLTKNEIFNFYDYNHNNIIKILKDAMKIVKENSYQNLNHIFSTIDNSIQVKRDVSPTYKGKIEIREVVVKIYSLLSTHFIKLVKDLRFIDNPKENLIILRSYLPVYTILGGYKNPNLYYSPSIIDDGIQTLQFTIDKLFSKTGFTTNISVFYHNEEEFQSRTLNYKQNSEILVSELDSVNNWNELLAYCQTFFPPCIQTLFINATKKHLKNLERLAFASTLKGLNISYKDAYKIWEIVFKEAYKNEKIETGISYHHLWDEKHKYFLKNNKYKDSKYLTINCNIYINKKLCPYSDNIGDIEDLNKSRESCSITNSLSYPIQNTTHFYKQKLSKIS